MTTWIVFFRGINVGGNNLLPMKSLSALLEKQGCKNVLTYIQSGNVVFSSSEKDRMALEKQIAAAVGNAHRFEPRILALGVKELGKAIANNPFRHAEADHKSLHFYFLAAKPTAVNRQALDDLKLTNESYAVKGKVFYLHAPDGVGRSKLATRAEKVLGVDATARNWQTVSKVYELACKIK